MSKETLGAWRDWIFSYPPEVHTTSILLSVNVIFLSHVVRARVQ